MGTANLQSLGLFRSYARGGWGSALSRPGAERLAGGSPRQPDREIRSLDAAVPLTSIFNFLAAGYSFSEGADPKRFLLDRDGTMNKLFTFFFLLWLMALSACSMTQPAPLPSGPSATVPENGSTNLPELGSIEAVADPGLQTGDCPTAQPCPTTIPLQRNWFEPMQTYCDSGECLFHSLSKTRDESGRSDLMGITYFSGHYIRVDRFPMDPDVESVICDAFVITDTTLTMQRAFEQSIAQGNTRSRPNAEGQYVIQLNLEPLTGPEREQIWGSTQENPLTLLVFLRPARGFSPPVCYSEFDILRVNPDLPEPTATPVGMG
jgi:hypothetical protein